MWEDTDGSFEQPSGKTIIKKDEKTLSDCVRCVRATESDKSSIRSKIEKRSSSELSTKALRKINLLVEITKLNDVHK